ncbi:phosphotriesterase-related protein [Jannaschia seohaensis]|uniref:Phosphotriesterase-related protein n=1 Tax=Jannaschia seohaensis TaxID=475081 RepID=A0A2Y9C3N7_9RHOB|nr:phosphotriesterase-related protein [Jannaschia seohaensis]SSA38143.1 phosphotriesterase-related protein [Jannaschia seohaensis]
MVRTVLGDVDPARLGPVAVHEHVLFDIVPPGATGDRDVPIQIEDRWQVDYRSNEAPANAHQTDADAAARELAWFAEEGGSVIVDQSVAGLARDAAGLAAASKASGVHVVAAAGRYTDAYLSPEMRAMEVDALTDLFTAEVVEGLDGTPIRAGLIGEMGCSWPMTEAERRALRAAARAARATGAALSVHPGRAPGACMEILDLVEEEGHALSRTILCHMDRTHPDGGGIAALLDRGACVEWDFFGIEQSHYWMGETELPMDRDRVRLIARFAEAGHADRILVSQDICTKTRLRGWGGHGYGHILRNVVPLMRRLGLDPDLIDRLIRTNPLRLLTLKETQA